MLLRAVVEIALELPPRIDARLDDAGARGSQLLDARAESHFQTLVLDGEHGAGSGCAYELRPGVQVGVVDDGGHATALVLDGGPCPAGLDIGQLNRQAMLVDERFPFGQPVGDRERLVSDALCKRLSNRSVLLGGAGEQSPRDRAQRSPEAVEDRNRDDPRRQREHRKRGARQRPELPRAEIAFASGQSLRGVERERDGERDRGQCCGSGAHAGGQAQREQENDPACGRCRCVRQLRDPRSKSDVREAPFLGGQPPRQP